MADSTDPNAGAGLGSGDTSTSGAPTVDTSGLPTGTFGGGGGSNANTIGAGGGQNVPGAPTANNGGLLGTLFPGMSTNTANAIGQLVGLGSGIGGTALNAAALTNAINYLKGIGAQAQGQQQPAYGAGWTAFGNNNNNAINPIFNGSNPYMNLLQNGVVGNINTLNGMLPGLTTGAPNLVQSNPTMNAYLGLSTRPIDFLTGQAQAAGNLVGAGGQTANNSYLANRANQLAGLNPLLSMGQAGSMAIDQAARSNQQAAQTVRAQALARGGGAGAVAGAGAANGGLADFSDQSLQNVSGSLQNALLGQQDLNLNQVLGGLNAGQGAAALQQSLLNTGLTQGANNALGASGLSQNAIQQLLAGQMGGAQIGTNLAQLFQGQNQQLANAANSGIGATLGAGQLSNNQGDAFLNYAANVLGTQARTGGSIADMLKQSPWAQFLLGGAATGAGGGGLNIGQIVGGAGQIANAAGKILGGNNVGGNNFSTDPFVLGFGDPGSSAGGFGGGGGMFGGFGDPNALMSAT